LLLLIVVLLLRGDPPLSWATWPSSRTGVSGSVDLAALLPDFLCFRGCWGTRLRFFTVELTALFFLEKKLFDKSSTTKEKQILTYVGTGTGT
jgi:hypothetical protein